MKSRASFSLQLAALVALGLALFLGKSWDTTLRDIDSNIHASLSLRVTSDGIAPRLPMTLPVEASWKNPGFPETPNAFNDHPFPMFWLSGHVMRALGPDAFSAKLLPSLFAIGCVLVLVWIGTMLRSRAYGVLAGLILLTTRDFILNAASFHLDTAMLFFILLSFAFWLRGGALSAGIAAGLGAWMKSPAALFLFPIAAFFLFSSRVGPPEKKLRVQSLVLSGLAACVTVALVWVIAGHLGGGELAWDYWKRQVWGTAVSGRGGQALDLLLFPKLLIRSYWPWLPLAVWGAARAVRDGSFRELRISLPLVAVVFGALLFSAMRFKYAYYFLPVYPFLALLAAEGLRPWVEAHAARFGVIVAGLGMLVPAVLLATPIPQGREPYPSMRKFAPEIEARSSSCEDEILLLSGGEETGSSLDLLYHAVFYTSLRVERAECSEAEALLAGESGARVRFVLGNADTLSNCLAPATLARFPERVDAGKRTLLSASARAREPDFAGARKASVRCTGP